MHLLTILQAEATDVLHSFSAEARYEDIGKMLEGCNRDHQLGAT
jgi:hypothetical protein